SGQDDFWTWRETMYGLVAQLAPDDLQAIAAQLYADLLRHGFTAVAEFHYVHHQPDGQPYDDPAEMSLRILAAAAEAGIGCTILPALYQSGGFGGAPAGPRQRRFLHRLERFDQLLRRLHRACAGQDGARLGLALHSLRAVPATSLEPALEMLD